MKLSSSCIPLGAPLKSNTTKSDGEPSVAGAAEFSQTGLGTMAAMYTSIWSLYSAGCEVDQDELVVVDLLFTESTIVSRTSAGDTTSTGTVWYILQLMLPGGFAEDSCEALLTTFATEILNDLAAAESILKNPVFENQASSIDPVWATPAIFVIEKAAYFSMTTIALIRPIAGSLIMGSAFGELADLISDQISQITPGLVAYSILSAPLAFMVAALKLLTGLIHLYIV